MGSQSFTCHPTQVNTPHLKPSHRPVLDLPTLEGWKADQFHAEMVYMPTDGDSHLSK